MLMSIFHLSAISTNLLLGVLLLITAVMYINSYRMNTLLAKRYPNIPNYLGWAGLGRYFKWMTSFNNRQPILSEEMKNAIRNDKDLHGMEMLHRILMILIVLIGIIYLFNTSRF